MSSLQREPLTPPIPRRHRWPERRMARIEGWQVCMSLNSAQTSWYLAQIYALSHQCPVVMHDFAQPQQPFYVSTSDFWLPKTKRGQYGKYRRRKFPVVGVYAPTISQGIEHLCIALSERLRTLVVGQTFDDLWLLPPASSERREVSGEPEACR